MQFLEVLPTGQKVSSIVRSEPVKLLSQAARKIPDGQAAPSTQIIANAKESAGHHSPAGSRQHHEAKEIMQFGTGGRSLVMWRHLPLGFAAMALCLEIPAATKMGGWLRLAVPCPGPVYYENLTVQDEE